MNSSLQTSLLLRTALSTALLLVLAGVALDLLVGARIQRQFDHALVDRSELIASTLEWGPAGLELDSSDLNMSEFASREGPGYLEILGPKGVSHYRTPSLSDANIVWPAGLSDSLSIFALPLPVAGVGRAICLYFQPRVEEDWAEELTEKGAVLPNAPVMAMYLARSYAEPLQMQGELRLLLVLVLILVLVVMSATLIWAVSSGLSPIRSLAQRVSHMDERDLSGRLDESLVPREVEVLTGQINALLDRLESAFSRERRFSADLAHELRTPLAGLRSQLDVGLSKARPGEEYQNILRASSEIASGMESLVADLLALSRFESDQFKGEYQEFQLRSLAESVWESYEEAAQNRNLKLYWDCDKDTRIQSETQHVERLLRNILENAGEYSDEGGEIRIGIRRAKHWVNLSVSNTGCLLSGAKARNLIDRFRRGDSSRTGTGEHCGLGLSLVQEIVRVIGAKMEIQAEVGGLYRISIDFPLSD